MKARERIDEVFEQMDKLSEAETNLQTAINGARAAKTIEELKAAHELYAASEMAVELNRMALRGLLGRLRDALEDESAPAMKMAVVR